MQTSLSLYTPFPDGCFDRVKKDYARMDNAKKLTPEQEIERLNHVISGYKGVITKMKKQFKKR